MTEVNEELSAKQKTSIRRIMRDKYSGKTFTQSEYKNIINQISKDNGVHTDTIDEFLGIYKKFPKVLQTMNANTETAIIRGKERPLFRSIMNMPVKHNR